MVIEVYNLMKCFSARHQSSSALGRVLGLFAMSKNQDIKALSEISFGVNKGEVVGLIGNNGSGKSTLLRVLAGIYRLDGGHVVTQGKVISIIGFGAVFNPRLTMVDNIVSSCAIYGLDSRTTRRKIEDIIAFAELGDYRHEPLYKFSSGMGQRLAFSIIIHCIEALNASTLLLDEVLAVGDVHFVDKSLRKLKDVFSDELAIVIAGHDLDSISEICTRAIWLEKGKIVMDGKSEEVVGKYRESIA